MQFRNNLGVKKLPSVQSNLSLFKLGFNLGIENSGLEFTQPFPRKLACESEFHSLHRERRAQ